MKKEALQFSIIFCLVVLTSTDFILAQSTLIDLEDALGFEKDVRDVPESPIHFLVGIFMAVGAWLGIQKLN